MLGVRWAALGLGSAVWLAAAGARGHEFRPALLTIMAAEDGAVVALLMGAGSSGREEGITLELPAQCSITRDAAVDGAGLRWSGRCAAPGLVGAIAIEGLPAEVDVVVELRRPQAPPQTLVLRGGALRGWVGEGARPGLWGYTWLGVGHIVGGADHLLFVAGLVLMSFGSGTWWSRRAGLGLLATLTAFTAAHSLTLAAAALGWVTVRSAPVEACIALSIVALARALVRGRAGAAVEWRFAFGCGLLHGLGFAGALAAVGLPEGALVPALLAFNCGVELGQVAVAAALAAALWGLWRVFGGDGAGRITRAAGYGIGAVAMAWFFERVAALGSP
jgi:hypothetical protein